MAKQDVDFEERLDREYDLKRPGSAHHHLERGPLSLIPDPGRDLRGPLFSKLPVHPPGRPGRPCRPPGWLRRTKTNRGCANIAIALTIFDVGGIAIMIQVLGDSRAMSRVCISSSWAWSSSSP